jgi:hypothetical protein
MIRKCKRGADVAPRILFACNDYQLPPERAGFIFEKQSLQYTGLSCRGRKGTWVFVPQLSHTASYIWREPP